MAPTRVVKAAVKYSVKAIAAKPRHGPAPSRRARWGRAWLGFQLKLQQNRKPLLTTLVCWGMGFLYYWGVRARPRPCNTPPRPMHTD
jgi:hypothetical protein